MLTPEQLELRDTFRRFAEREIAPHAAAADEHAEYPWKSFEAYRDSGFVRLSFPEEHGGDGADTVTYAMFVEEMARVCASSALFVIISKLAMTPLMMFGSPELQARYVPRVAAGELQASYCLSEPDAGSDVASMSARAVRDGDHYVLRGTKAWITNAGVSDLYVVFAKTDPDAGHRGISAFVVERDTPGLSIGEPEVKMGMRGSPTCEIYLDDAVVPAANLIGEEGKGFTCAMGALDSSRPIIGVQALGIAQGALDAATHYVQQRRQFGQRIADFQGVQFMLAEMATQVEAARLLIYEACELLDAGDPRVSKLASMSKLFAADTAMRVTTDAVQLFGGAGYTRRYPVERMMRDAKLTQIYEGTNQVQRVVIARHLLDEGAVMDGVRVRYSPAPSGEIHVGNAGTALFNWLYARHVGGVFILRIEDTDRSRTTEAAITGVQETLRWLGLDWDEGPVLQSDRTDLYHDAVDRLLAAGLAYECYCTEDELKARNEAARAAGHTPGYDGHCRDLTPEQRAAYATEDRTSVVRFRTPDTGVSRFHDLIRGDVEVEWSLIYDFVILRSDGSPIFFLANAVDDIDMEITHVIRGEDLLDTTHRVLAIREGLGGGPQPVYAHLPLILAADRAKLSKRHGADSVEEFREQGYLPEALVNYLSLLGWSAPDGREVLSSDELVAEFELERVTHAPAVFDPKKLEWMNGQWIRRLELDELARRVEPQARARFGDRLELDVFRDALAIGQERASTTAQLVEQMDFLFVDDDNFAIDPDSWAKLESTERVREVFDAVIGHIERCDWTVESIDLRDVIDGLGLKARKAMPALYAAVEGRAQGLPLFDSIWLLGRERALARLRAARDRLGSETPGPLP